MYLNYFERLWEEHGSGIGELTMYSDDFVVVCKTKKDAEHAYELIRRIMKRLKLILHPNYTNYSQKRLTKLDWYILQRLIRWYSKKTKWEFDEFII
ncbi:hypothetical protein [Paenibacillus donghaensis]|uniref:hypothetical protein n=1 Tax=Paenibacillus donghaensis TaxID=414771 RepID=UPI001FEB867A|nr:hypothetical protein [Paenibacillus donghaensis]